MLRMRVGLGRPWSLARAFGGRSLAGLGNDLFLVIFGQKLVIGRRSETGKVSRSSA